MDGVYTKQINLHSTMFLLKRENPVNSLLQIPGFTFHNVSIKTGEAGKIYVDLASFTFHNVSIKTEAAVLTAL